MQTEVIVKERYAAGAQAVEAALCCPVSYNPEYLKVIPTEVIERDYGCGDPSQYVRRGETVLDLGSGTGKIGFIASQVVGAEGRVIGVDMTDAMLEVARRYAPVVAERIGYANVTFHKGRIQDLALDLDVLEARLKAEPILDANSFLRAQDLAAELRASAPMIADDSIDVVVSNCVLNLVAQAERDQLFREIYRVLKVGGRAIISDIVSDERVPVALQRDPVLWSGCISGAFQEADFIDAFARAGFHGMMGLKRDEQPWQTVEGYEFRSVTVAAYKGKEGPCWEHNQAVIYKGPFKAVTDDDGHTMERGLRYAVCEKTYRLYQREPYAEAFDFIEPRVAIAAEAATPFDCSVTPFRHPRESKGMDYDATTAAAKCC
jgi:arsenite methyltransferase